jgi:hypothetical protein
MAVLGKAAKNFAQIHCRQAASVDGFGDALAAAFKRKHGVDIRWKTLVDEGIADAFILGDYEQVSVSGSSYWTAKPDVRPREGEDLFAWAAREYQAHCKGKTRLYLFGEWLPGTAELDARLQFFGDLILKHAVDGIDLHEASNFEGGPAGMKALRTFAGRLKGNVPSR